MNIITNSLKQLCFSVSMQSLYTNPLYTYNRYKEGQNINDLKLTPYERHKIQVLYHSDPAFASSTLMQICFNLFFFMLNMA